MHQVRGLPGIFDPTIFAGGRALASLEERIALMPSRFIKAAHPKTEILPTAEAVAKILRAGWVGQMKVHGHRVQLHIPVKGEILAFTRQGQPHKKLLSDSIISELRRLLAPTKGWNVIEGEWVKPKDKIYLFDFLKLEDELLNRRKYVDRWKELPRAYLSPHVQTLPVLTTQEKCMDLLASDDDEVEGLVFKSSSPGFADTSVIRCRRTQARKARTGQA